MSNRRVKRFGFPVFGFRAKAYIRVQGLGFRDEA